MKEQDDKLTDDASGDDAAAVQDVTAAPAADALRREVEEWRDKYVRKLAEFENFRKRSRAELEQSREGALDSVLSGLLPVLDDFDRVLAGYTELSEAHQKGLELIRAKLWGFFAARGVEKMDVLGKEFDAAEHEALAAQPTADFPPHTVMAVVAPGYRRGDRVIRHAQVIVSQEPSATDAAEPDAS